MMWSKEKKGGDGCEFEKKGERVESRWGEREIERGRGEIYPAYNIIYTPSYYSSLQT